MVQLAVAVEEHYWCSAGNFGVADIFMPNIGDTNRECEQCPIGSYNANTNSNIKPTVCTLCGAGSYTTSVGQSASSSCTACSNSAGVATWKSNSFVRKTFQTQHPDLVSPEPLSWCDPDNNYGYYCNIGRVVGLCEISTCSTPGYTLGTDIDYSKAGTKSYAIGRVTPTADNNFRDLTCYINGSASGDNCDTSRSTFAGMDYGEWMVDFDYSVTSGGSLMILQKKYIYGESKCNASSSSYSNNTSGNNCWCHATAETKTSGMGLLGNVVSKYVVSDAIWRRVGSYSSCEQVCPNYCAEQVKTNQTTRTAMLKDSDGKPVFDTVCNVNTYNINYVMNGGTSGGSQPASATYNEVFNVTNPTKTGLVFLGWDISGMDSTMHDYGSVQNSLTQHTTATSLLNTTRTWFKNLRATSGTVTFTAQWGCATGYTERECPLRGVVDPQKNSEVYKYVEISASSYEINDTELFPGEWFIEFPYGTVRGSAQCVNSGNTWDCQCKPTMFSNDHSFASGHAQGIGTISWVNVGQFQSQSLCEASCAGKCAGNISGYPSFREPWGKCEAGCQPNVCFVNYHYVSNGDETWPTPRMTPALFSAETPVASFTVSNPSRPNYAFVAWCENAGLSTNCSGTKTIATNSCTTDQSVINLYANWNQLIVLQWYNQNTQLNNEPQSCIYGTPYSATTGAISPIVPPTRPGYDFAGWTVTGHQQ